MTRYSSPFFILFFLILGSCGGPTGDITFFSIQQDIFTSKCATSGCHTSAAAGTNANLDLSNIDDSFEMLLGTEGSGRVGRASSQQPSVKRVKPEDPENSYLIQKLRGDAGITGVQMPYDGPPHLSDVEIELIKGWISDGAHK